MSAQGEAGESDPAVRTGRKRWRDLSPRQRAAAGLAIAAQLSLQAAALVDLRRRPARRVNGDKRVWAIASLVNFVGPIAYFAFGRRRRRRRRR